MYLDNDLLKLELINEGGEMSRLQYKGRDILYKGDGPYWKGKNPTLFPMISSPDSKKYIYDGKEYFCRNHGIIRYSTLETIINNEKQVTMRLISNEETLKEYPFNFEYNITYKLDDNKVLINYEIINKDIKTMPFTFGLHPGFLVDDIKKIELIFPDDEEGQLYNQKTKTTSTVKLGTYTNFINDLIGLETVIFKHLKSKYVILKTGDCLIKVDISKFNYLAIWSANPNANYICIEPWLSINDIRHSDNPFDSEFELEYLKPNEVFKIDYYIELN